jgi:hypothetical protein
MYRQNSPPEKAYLTTTATSVPSERFFSAAVDIVSLRKTCTFQAAQVGLSLFILRDYFIYFVILMWHNFLK